MSFPLPNTRLSRNSESGIRGAYCYGFQAQEQDIEMWSGSVTYKYRVEDPRLGRFFSVDPLFQNYPHNSPYAFSENKLIHGVELEGLEFYYTADGQLLGSINCSEEVYVVNDDKIDEVKLNIDWANHQILINGPFIQSNIDAANANCTKIPMTNTELNVRAFLTVIRKGEGTLGEGGYSKMFGGGVIQNFEEHPNKVINKGTYSSSAAGAYQILKKTWFGTKGVQARADLGITDFSPECQDEFAIWLLGDVRDAIDELSIGDFSGAVEETNQEWASLPNSPYGQPTQNMKEAELLFRQAIAAELNGESEIATGQGGLETVIKQVEN